jgi:hypothetical protein
VNPQVGDDRDVTRFETLQSLLQDPIDHGEIPMIMASVWRVRKIAGFLEA